MALYYFHIQTNVRESDTDGTECATAHEAREQAIATCGQMMKDAAPDFWGSRPWIVTVTDFAGTILWQISMDGFAAPAALALE